MKIILSDVKRSSETVHFSMLDFNFKVSFDLNQDPLLTENDYYDIGKFISKEILQHLLNNYNKYRC